MEEVLHPDLSVAGKTFGADYDLAPAAALTDDSTRMFSLSQGHRSWEVSGTFVNDI